MGACECGHEKQDHGFVCGPQEGCFKCGCWGYRVPDGRPVIVRSAQPVVGRAETDEAKREVLDRLYEAWKRTPKLRLSQLIYVVTNGRDIFYDEDYPLLAEIEKYADHHGS